MNTLPSELAYHLTQAIEKMPPSEQQTHVSLLASRLYQHLRDLEMIERGLAKLIAIDQARRLMRQIEAHKPRTTRKKVGEKRRGV